MFEHFTDRARQAVVLAQEEARALKHDYIGTEHLLLGLLREAEGLAARVLESLDITVERVRAQVVRTVGSGEEVTSGQIPFTPRAKKVLELALREALSLGHNYIGTEHILLGVLREKHGLAAMMLLDFGADSETIRSQLLRMLKDPSARPEADPDRPRDGATAAAPEASTAAAEEVTGLSDDDLHLAIDRSIERLIREDQEFSARRRSLHDNINSLRAELRRRRHDDH